MGGKMPVWAAGASCRSQCGRGETKPRGRAERLPTSLPKQVTCSPRPHLVGQKESVWGWNTSRSGIWKCPGRYIQECAGDLEAVHQSLVLQMGKGTLNSHFRLWYPHSLRPEAPKLPSCGPLSPSSSKLPLRKLFSSSPPSCPTLLLPSAALSRYTLMSRMAWPHYSAGTTTTLTL